MKLSILDQAPISKGDTSIQTLQHAEELAILGDTLGYKRFWISEHHSSKAYASSAPEIMLAHLANKTKNIRLGTGGIMLMHYSSLKMAEVISTLSALANGRIDFGAGRAPGGDKEAVYALAEGNKAIARNLYEKFENTLKLIAGEQSTHALYKNVISMPQDTPLPKAWFLGSSGKSSLEISQLGVGYAFAQFLMGDLTKEVIDIYRDNFKPSIYLEKPEVMVVYLVTTAETKEEAEYLAKPQDIWRLNFDKGHIEQIMSPEEASNYPLTEMDKLTIEENRKIHFVGDINEISTKLQEEQAVYHFDEAMICSVQHSHEKRLNMYKLLAQELIN